MDRRTFLATTALLPAVASLLKPTQASKISFGYAAITWGGNDPLAIDEIADVGYRGIQLRASAVERWRSDPAALKELLRQRKLEFVALSSGVLALDPAKEQETMALHSAHAKFAAQCGCHYLQVVDERPRNRTITADDHKRMGRLLTELGKRCQDHGVKLGYHNHMGNLGESPNEVSAVLGAADHRYVGLELDTAHWAAAGGDPVEAVRQYHDKILFVHLKDLARNVDGRPYRFREPGSGELDIKGVLTALDAAAFEGWVIVELDYQTAPNRSAKESAVVARNYLSSIGYEV